MCVLLGDVAPVTSLRHIMLMSLDLHIQTIGLPSAGYVLLRLKNIDLHV